jgi:hypothetical protein
MYNIEDYIGPNSATIKFVQIVGCSPISLRTTISPIITSAVMYIEVRQHNFVYLRNINKLYFTKSYMFRQLPSSGLFLLNFSGMEGLPDDKISLSVLLGSSFYNTKYTVSSLLVLGLSYLVAVGMVSRATK